MGWMQKCLETYEKISGNIENSNIQPLLPIGFVMQKTHIEIMLDKDGNFVKAATVPKEDSKTIIPATSESSIRSSGIAPHPLCDQLGYCAFGCKSYIYANVGKDKYEQSKLLSQLPINDFLLNTGEEHNKDGEEYKKSLKKYEQYEKKYEAYMKLLKSWAESQYSHYIVNAVYEYLKKEQTLFDLCKSDILEYEDSSDIENDKVVLKNGKIADMQYEKCIIRWRVIGGETNGECWSDRSLFNSYYNFMSHSNDPGVTGTCCVTGEICNIAKLHPQGIVASSYNARIISANDEYGFTFKGRFLDKEEALSIGSITTNKAHNALKWLIANQGNTIGGKTFLAWNPSGKEVPKGGVTLYESTEEQENNAVDTMPEYKEKIRDAINGYRLKLGDNEDVIIMILDAATKGRLSITYYNELVSSDLFNRLENWYTSCCWYKWIAKKGEKPSKKVVTPNIYQIVNYAFGTEQSEIVKADDKVVKEYSQIIMQCIIDGQSIPKNIIKSISERASLRQAYNSKNYENLLYVSCALIRKYRNDLTEKEEWLMELQTENNNRSYLFGRLLAIYEKVERDTYSMDDKREPNACRLQAIYVKHPMNTVKTLETALVSYWGALNPGLRIFYKNLISDIFLKFNETSQEELNRPLEDTYLLGYYLQRRELYKKKEENKQEEN